MEIARRVLSLRVPASAAALVLVATAAAVPAAASAPIDAESSYQAGVQAYAAGRREEAAGDFRKALRLDPEHRAARRGLARLRAESLARAPAPAAAAAPRALPPPDGGFLAALLRAYYFERTLGDARADLGRVEAALGRIAQLEAERRARRARGLRDGRGDELRALSRRLGSVSV